MEEDFRNVYKVLDDIGEDILNEMESVLLTGAKYPKRAKGDLLKSLDYDITFENPGNFNLSIEFAPHGVFVLDGRRKGTKNKKDRRGVLIYNNIPPVDVIEKWAKTKGFNVRKNNSYWGIAVNIAKNGILPLNFVKPYEDIFNVKIKTTKNDIKIIGNAINPKVIKMVGDAYQKDIEIKLKKIIKGL